MTEGTAGPKKGQCEEGGIAASMMQMLWVSWGSRDGVSHECMHAYMEVHVNLLWRRYWNDPGSAERASSPLPLNLVLWRRYWNDPEMLSKLGKAMGGTFDFPGLMGAAPGEEGAGAEAEGEEEGEEEETLHAAASAGEGGEARGGRQAKRERQGRYC